MYKDMKMGSSKAPRETKVRASGGGKLTSKGPIRTPFKSAVVKGFGGKRSR